jgi:hypothetical protein
LRGTRILTDCGEVAVEDLRIGDKVVTADHGAMPVNWIGRRRFRRSPGCRWPAEVMPIRVSACAIDDQTPHRDLYLSRSHAVRVDGVLLPVDFLLNRRSITPAPVEDVDTLQYFHIMLQSHEVIFAEGTPAETLFAGQEYFSNFVEYERLYGPQDEDELTLAGQLPIYSYRGRTALKGLAMCAVSPFMALPDPAHAAYNRLAARSKELAARTDPVGCRD